MLEAAIDRMTRALTIAADEVIPELVAEPRAMREELEESSAQLPLPAISLALDVAGARP